MAVAALIMLGLPWLSVTFADSMSGMLVSIILFFSINPVFSIIMGACAGQDIKGYWYMPAGNAGFFLLGIWLYISKDISPFYPHAIVYLALGIVSMIISLIVKKRGRNKKES